MVLKNNLTNIYNLTILILISLLLLMLYLGNYNLIEGNGTSSHIISNLSTLLYNNQNKTAVLKDNVPYNNDCSSMENMNDEYLENIRDIGGAQTPEAEVVRNASQAKATLCGALVANK